MLSAEDEMTENITMQRDEQVLTTNTVPSERTDTVDNEEVPQVEFASIETTV